MDEHLRDALNDMTDAMERLREALHDEDVEQAQEAFDALTEALNVLKSMIGPVITRRHGPETA